MLDSEVPSLLRIIARALALRLNRRAPRQRPAAPQRILVAPHLRLGDAILITPLLAKLRARYPTAEIVLVSSLPMLPLYQSKPFGVVVWPYHPRRYETVAAMLAQPGFDLAIIPGDNRLAWLAAALQARWIVAHAEDRPQCKSWLVDELIPYPDHPMAMGEIFAELAPGPEPAPYTLADWPAPACAPFTPPPRPFALLHVGASTPMKYWPTASWRGLAQALQARGLVVVWSTGPGEERLVQEVDPEGRFASYAGTLDLAQMWRLIGLAEVFVSPDTGVAHLARLVGTPAVALFGPGSASLFGQGRYFRNTPCVAVETPDFPCRNQHDVFSRERPWVQRCSRGPSACAQPRCMAAIDVGWAMRAITDVQAITRRGAHSH